LGDEGLALKSHGQRSMPSGTHHRSAGQAVEGYA
jgi:hypothetical protein